MVRRGRSADHVVETADEFFRRRAADSGVGLQHYLDMVPNVSPEPGDELPEGWKRHHGAD